MTTGSSPCAGREFCHRQEDFFEPDDDRGAGFSRAATRPQFTAPDKPKPRWRRMPMPWGPFSPLPPSPAARVRRSSTYAGPPSICGIARGSPWQHRADIDEVLAAGAPNLRGSASSMPRRRSRLPTISRRWPPCLWIGKYPKLYGLLVVGTTALDSIKTPGKTRPRAVPPVAAVAAGWPPPSGWRRRQGFPAQIYHVPAAAPPLTRSVARKTFHCGHSRSEHEQPPRSIRVGVINYPCLSYTRLPYVLYRPRSAGPCARPNETAQVRWPTWISGSTSPGCHPEIVEAHRRLSSTTAKRRSWLKTTSSPPYRASWLGPKYVIVKKVNMAHSLRRKACFGGMPPLKVVDLPGRRQHRRPHGLSCARKS